MRLQGSRATCSKCILQCELKCVCKIVHYPPRQCNKYDLKKIPPDPQPKQRPSMAAVMAHPFWWPPGRRLAFLIDLSDRVENEDREVTQASETRFQFTYVRLLDGRLKGALALTSCRQRPQERLELKSLVERLVQAWGSRHVYRMMP